MTKYTFLIWQRIILRSLNIISLGDLLGESTIDINDLKFFDNETLYIIYVSNGQISLIGITCKVMEGLTHEQIRYTTELKKG